MHTHTITYTQKDSGVVGSVFSAFYNFYSSTLLAIKAASFFLAKSWKKNQYHTGIIAVFPKDFISEHVYISNCPIIPNTLKSAVIFFKKNNHYFVSHELSKKKNACSIVPSETGHLPIW